MRLGMQLGRRNSVTFILRGEEVSHVIAHYHYGAPLRGVSRCAVQSRNGIGNWKSSQVSASIGYTTVIRDLWNSELRVDSITDLGVVLGERDYFKIDSIDL